MTLDTTVRRINYQGDDRTTCFSFPFKVWGEEQVVVYCSDPATPWTETNITQRTTITLNTDNYGGAVVFANPPAAGSNLAIVREGSFLQEDEYLSGSRFDAHEIEDRFDEDAAERQELLDATARSIKVPNSSTQTPEEVYEELLSGSAFVNNAIASLTELYNQALYYYNLTMGYLGETSYMQSRETSFTISQTHIIDGDNGEGDWIHTFYDGFTYYPTTHQLLVTVDGLALTPDVHFSEIGEYGEESTQIRFYINLYQGQRVYIKAMFLGTEEFNVKLQEMDDKIEDANNDLQDAVEAAKADFEDRTNTLNDLIEETTENFQAIIDGLDEEIAQTESLIQDALEIVGTSENWKTFQDAITELNGIYSTFTSNELPTQGYCELDSAYYGGSCLTLPGDVCYFKGTNTLHLAIDGLVLSPKYFEEVGGCICTPPLVEGGLQDTFYYGANFVKIPEGVCLYKGQELHAWTESFWGREGWEPEEYQPDITTRLYATSTSGNIYYSDDLGRCWSSIAGGLEGNADGESSTGQLPECLRGQRIVATSDTLWAFTAPQEAEDDDTDDEQEDESQEENRSIAGSIAAGLAEQEDAAPPAGTLVFSTDGGLTWDCYIKNSDDDTEDEEEEEESQEKNGEENSDSNGWQSSFGTPHALAATDNALVLATCNGIFYCPTGCDWCKVFSEEEVTNDYHWGLIEAASDGSGFLAVDTANDQEESTPDSQCRQIVYFSSAPSVSITCSCTNNISDVTAIAGNGQYWMITDACGQVEYAANSVAAGAWQAGAQMPQGSNGDGVNCIYGAREGFISLGSGAACTSSPRNAWKCSAEVGGTLCAGLHLQGHGLYLAVGGDTSCAYTLWSWDGLNWNCGCGVPRNAVLNNLWTSEHLPFFANEPVTELEPMSPAAGLEEEVPPEDEDQEGNDEGGELEDGNTGDGEGGEDDSEDDENEDGEEEEEEEGEGSESQEESQTGSGIATALQALAASEQAASENEHCYLWGPISPTYQLKSDLCFDGSSIPVHITIDQAMSEGTGANNSHGNGATIAIYKSDTYQRLTRDDLNIENNDSTATEQGGWCEFARYEATGPIAANTELYTCFTTAGQNGSGEATVEDESETESYPTCWPTGYYAAAIYNVYGGCSLQSSIPKVNFYVNRKERYSSCAAGTEPDDTTGTEGETND